MDLLRKAAAELVGTFWLVLGGCGAAVLSRSFRGEGIGIAGVAIAFGLAVLTMGYAVGRISGGHFNPTVTVAMTIAGRIPRADVPAYVAAQLAGSIAAAAVLYAIASGSPDLDVAERFATYAANGYGAHSPGGFSLGACLLAELVFGAVFAFIVLGATARPARAGLAPIATGLALAAIHLVGIPITNVSVNPARSTGPALFVGGWALAQLWLFWAAPLVGGAVGAAGYQLLTRPTAARPRPRAVLSTG